MRSPEQPQRAPWPTQGSSLVLRAVSFNYPSRPSQRALNGLTGEVRAGQTVAIVGPSGAGKTTLFSLLMRFYRAQHGEVLLDGVAIEQMDLHDLRQRIAIARTILKNPPMLLLDEATSALDANSERMVQAALQKAMQGRTTLVIAHRLATVQRADCIWVLEHGRLVEQGTHAELMARAGLYASLAALQFLTQWFCEPRCAQPVVCFSTQLKISYITMAMAPTTTKPAKARPICMAEPAEISK